MTKSIETLRAENAYLKARGSREAEESRLRSENFKLRHPTLTQGVQNLKDNFGSAFKWMAKGELGGSSSPRTTRVVRVVKGKSHPKKQFKAHRIARRVSSGEYIEPFGID